MEKRCLSSKKAGTAALYFGILLAIVIGIFALERGRREGKETAELWDRAEEIEQSYSGAYEVDSEYKVFEDDGSFVLSSNYLKVQNGTRIIREDSKEKKIRLPIGEGIQEIIGEGSLRKLFINDEFEVSAISYIDYKDKEVEYVISELSEEGDLKILHKHSMRPGSMLYMALYWLHFYYFIYLIIVSAAVGIFTKVSQIKGKKSRNK